MRLLQIVLVVFFISFSRAFGYYDSWAPFEQGAYRHLDLSPVADRDIPSFIRDHSGLDEGGDVQFNEVYKGDLTGNGQVDFIVLNVEPSPYMNGVDLYLKTGQCYRMVTYRSVAVGLEDFIVGKSGKPAVIISGVYWANSHDYMSYNAFEFQDYKLVNADKEFGLPKFILMTDKPNHRDTRRLTQKERLQQTNIKNNSISYEDIP